MLTPNRRTRNWVIAPLLPGAGILAATTIHNRLLPETIFLGGLLIWLPLARQLSSSDRSGRDQFTTSRYDQLLSVTFWPCVATAAASTSMPRGSISGGIAACWCVWTVASAVLAMIRFMRNTPRSLPALTATVSSTYLVVSAAWFTCWRGRINPLDFPDGITLLTGVHFLYAGYLLPAVATGLFPESLAIRHRAILVGMILIMPIIAVGITCSPMIEIIGVLLAMLVVLLFCGELLMLSSNSDQPMSARVLMTTASVCGVLAIGLAVYYGFSEYTGNTWILIPTMIRWHGVLNSTGLIGGTLSAWALINFSEARSGLPSATAKGLSRLSPDSSPNSFEAYRESCASTDSRSQ